MAQKAKRKTATKTPRKTSHKAARKTVHRKTARGKTGRKWSQRVTETSDAMDLRDKVFTQASPAAIARSIKRSAEHSHRRKSSPYRSAMSMLTFYINRAGKQLSAARRKKLEQAKDELRKAFNKKPD